MNPAEYLRMYVVEDRHWWYAGLHELVLEAVRRESRRLGRPLNVLDAGAGRLCELLGREGRHVTGTTGRRRRSGSAAGGGSRTSSRRT